MDEQNASQAKSDYIFVRRMFSDIASFHVRLRVFILYIHLYMCDIFVYLCEYGYMIES